MTGINHRAIPAADADVIVIGAGLNGLACALQLAQARLRVLILEGQDRPGGYCATSEVIPGYRAPLYTHWIGPLDPALVKALKQQKLGLEIAQPRMGPVALGAGGRHILLDVHARRGVGALAQHSQADAKTLGPFDAAMRKLAAGLGAQMNDVPLRIGAKGAPAPRVKQDEAAKAALAGLAMRSIASLVEEYFESPVLQGALALDAVIGTGLGPRTPGSALAWIERLAIETVRSDTAIWVQGGPGALINAVGQAAYASGADLRCNAQVVDLIAAQGRAHGVVLANGETLYAPAIVASLAPGVVAKWRTVRRAAPAGWPETFAPSDAPPHGLAKVHLALRGAPRFEGLDAKDLRQRLLIATSLDAVDAAYGAALAGETPSDPPMEVVLPSMIDPSLAPKDGHILSALIPFAPLTPHQGWREAKGKLTLDVIAALARFAPDLPNRVLSADVETPETLARISPSQSALWRQPLDAPLHPANPYACDVAGLFFCGAGTHPRLGASGLNGRNCAEAVLAFHASGAETAS
jgi:phytoene dehydrogenase-like protein